MRKIICYCALINQLNLACVVNLLVVVSFYYNFQRGKGAIAKNQSQG
ncbi:protein of unknown function [Legionella fallonii LLAP-10]|uniref:Uncharacterized protein n=1 Tax=Legionella fallonii LLAP-10 TaxID=1212491 RepID=A0A098G4I7_9GAMM|nr:protein of unknown function [Legionella fallonii LLAP-10]